MSNRGKPLVADSDSDRCEALTVMTPWKIAHQREQRCPFKARYIVQGHHFCSPHARMEAVAICMEQDDMKRLPSQPRQDGQRVLLTASRKHAAAKEGKG